MPTPVHAAARRLRGHLVETPILGGLEVPGFSVAPTIRVKAECVQTAGGPWFRGYLHYLLRSMGKFKGLVVHGDAAQVRAQLRAGALHRLPMVAIGILPAGVECERFDGEEPAAAARETGFHVLPGAEDRRVAAGIATLGLELAEELAVDVADFSLADAAFVDPVRQGLRAADREGEVRAVGAVSFPPEWIAAVHAGLRVVPDDAGHAALWAVRESVRPTCVVL